MTTEGLLDYVEEVLGRIARDSFGQRDAPVVSLSEDTRKDASGALSGTLEVHIRTRNGETPLIHTERFSELGSRKEVDDLFARALSVVLMNHAKWPR